MVRTQIVSRGIRDPRVIHAMLKVPRHDFVDKGLRAQAYSDNALPLFEGQTISQPYMVAAMTEILGVKPHDKVLEIGTGCGYQAAVLREMTDRVFSIERIQRLAVKAEENLANIGVQDVRIRVGDGTLGWPEEAPFDAIIVTAGAPEAPQTLFSQLNEGGRLVVPVGNRSIQKLMLVKKSLGEMKIEKQFDCVFVPLLGKEGW